MKNLNKKYLGITTLLLAFSISVSASCYSDWLDAYDSAVSEYRTDLNRCGKAWMCLFEAKFSFQKNINDASDAYHSCAQE